MRLARRRLVAAGAVFLASPSVRPRAERLPDLNPGKVRLLVGSAAGSPGDLIARTFVPFLEHHWPGLQADIVNLPGNAGLDAFAALARAAPDGQTLGWAATPSLPARMVDRGGGALMRKLRLIGAIQKEPVTIVSPAAHPVISMAEIIERSAATAEGVPFATPPAGSPPHLAMLKLQQLAGANLNLVPFPSATAARQAAEAGTVAAAAVGLSEALTGLKSGSLAGVGIFAANAPDAAPDIPPLRESGLPLSWSIRRGIAAPAGLPDAHAAETARVLRDVAADPDFAEQARASGFTVRWTEEADWTRQARAELDDLTKLWAESPWLGRSVQPPTGPPNGRTDGRKSDGGVAAVHQQIRAGHEARRVTGQE